MRKTVSIILCVAMIVCAVFAFSSCSKQNSVQADIVLITDGATVNDGGYNQSAWEGIKSYADENAYTSMYYQPALTDDELTVETIESYVELAVNNGAKYIVLPGEEFAVAAFEVSTVYPDVNFILIDAIPHSADDDTDRYISNVMCVTFDTTQSGFIAGFLAVMNGETDLGYFGEFDSDESANYGAGFVQGAAYAADMLDVPVTVEWADYDSALLDYSYDFTITACYEKIDEQTEDCYTVVVENGSGSGTYFLGDNVTVTADPAPKGQEFDYWEIKSNTDGVKDSKVNVSSEKKESINLLVEECDCTLTAVYKDVDYDQVTISVVDSDGSTVLDEYYPATDSSYWVDAPVASSNMVFDHWETSNDDAVEDLYSAGTTVNVGTQDITMTPIYIASSTPTFNVTVQTGEGGSGDSTGTGSYVTGDVVTLEAAVPEEGYMFSHWENTDAYGNATGIAMDNEYEYSTTFEMVDRYAAICTSMFNKGVTTIFAGGNSQASSVTTSISNFDLTLYMAYAGENNGDAAYNVVSDYGKAVQDCLANFQGGTLYCSDCSNDGIVPTFISDDESVQSAYEEVYSALADGTLTLTKAQGGAGYDYCKMFKESNPSTCLTLNGWFLELS